MPGSFRLANQLMRAATVILSGLAGERVLSKREAMSTGLDPGCRSLPSRFASA